MKFGKAWILFLAVTVLSACSTATTTTEGQAGQNQPAGQAAPVSTLPEFKSDSTGFTLECETLTHEVLSKVKDQHYNEAIVDWAGIYAKYLPKAKLCKGRMELVELMNAMVKELGHSHIAIMPPPNTRFEGAMSGKDKPVSKMTTQPNPYATVDGSPLKQVFGDIGITLCMADGKVCILDVQKGSTSEKAGLKAGDYVLSVNGFDIDTKPVHLFLKLLLCPLA